MTLDKQMQRENLFYRILAGNTIIEYDGEEYVIHTPSPEIRLNAINVYNKFLFKTRFDDWLTDFQCIQILASNGLCSMDVDENLKQISDQLDKLKLQLYKNISNPMAFKKAKKQLGLVKKKQLETLNIRHSLNHLTAEGFAEMEKRNYLMVHTLYKNGKRVWDNCEDIDYYLLERIMAEIVKSTINISEIRDLSRHEPWRSYWGINKGNPFPVTDTFSLSEEQKSLILYTRMYDSAYEHPECPDDSVIDDDDVFDGWMLYTREENKKKKKENSFNKTNDKIAKADEVYIPAETKDQIEQINNMNDLTGKMVRKQRDAVIKSNDGKTKDSEFQDRRNQITIQSNNQFKANFNK